MTTDMSRLKHDRAYTQAFPDEGAVHATLCARISMQTLVLLESSTILLLITVFSAFGGALQYTVIMRSFLR